MFIELLINPGLEKVRTDSLKFRTDLQSYGWSLKAGQSIAFKHRVSFATDLAANFGCNRFRIMSDIVPSFCAADNARLHLKSNLSRRPFLG